MRISILLMFCFFTLQTSWSQSYSEKETEEIKQFMIEFSKAAKAKDTLLLKTFVFSSKLNPTQDYQSSTINYVLQNDKNKQGDFAYSYEALQVVIDEEIHQFKPIPEQIYNMLIEQPDGIFYEATKDLSAEDIPIFDFKNTHIILVNRESNYQLIFWESLNNLLAP